MCFDTCIQYMLFSPSCLLSVFVCILSVGMYFPCVQECALFVKVSVCELVCVRVCTRLNLSVHVAVLCLHCTTECESSETAQP